MRGSGSGAGARAVAARGLDADPGGCPDSPPPLAGLPDDERRRALVAETARFAAAFQRWTEGRAGGGLPYTRLRLLQALHCGGPAIMRDLGDQLGVSPRNMTAMVDALEEAHLVERRPHPTDRRATLVELTGDGRHEAEQVLGPAAGCAGRAVRGLHPGRAAAVRHHAAPAGPGHAGPAVLTARRFTRSYEVLTVRR